MVDLVKFKQFIFYFIFISLILLTLLDGGHLMLDVQKDEWIYAVAIDRMKQPGFDFFTSLISLNENKSPLFYVLEIVLQTDKTIVFNRILNISLIIVSTYLIYSITKRKESLLFFIIPWSMNAMWLTNEMLEVPLILLAIQYAQYSGFFVGFAAILVPYSALFVPLLKRKQAIIACCIGIAFLGIVAFMSSEYFVFWIKRMTEYASSQQYRSELDPLAAIYYVAFFILGWKTPMFKYGVVASIPLLSQVFNHYFIPAYSMFMLGYLMQIGGQNK